MKLGVVVTKMLYFISLCLLLPLALQAEESPVIHMADDAWCPYVCSLEQDNIEGYVVEAVRAALASQGYTLKFTRMPYNSAIQQTRRMQIDGVLTAYPEDIPDFSYPMESVGLSIEKFIVHTDNQWRYSGLESLQGIRLGLVKGYEYPAIDPYIQMNLDSVYVQFMGQKVHAHQHNLRKLLIGRIDAMVDDAVVLSHTARILVATDRIRFAGATGLTYPVVSGFNPNNPQTEAYISIYNKGIQAIRANGTLQGILDRYGIDSWH